jgi:serine/threonine protein kinase
LSRALNIPLTKVPLRTNTSWDMTEPKISSIGKYRIIELVGEGAMGVVYRAIDPVLERTVAIKVMNESIARQADLRKRFLHEAQAAGSLQHPNVVCIYDLGEADGHLFIAMEFVAGVDLEHLIEKGEPLPLQSKLDIIIDVLTGLSFAHKRGIVHRDIKPANIRVAEDGRAKIMDFGVAHLASSSMTSTGSILGTPTFMAPEQITEGKTSPATDIFAVGGVLYQILTLMKPFDAPTLQNLFFKIITEKPRSVTELMPNLPPALDRIVNKAMAKEPADRYATALDMANELTNVRSKLSGPSYPASVSLSQSVASAIEQSRQSTRIRTRKLAFVGGSTIAAAAVVAIAWSQLPRNGSATPDPASNQSTASVPAQIPTASAAPVQTTATTPEIQKPSTPAPPPRSAPQNVRQEKPTPARAASTVKTQPKPVQTTRAAPPPVFVAPPPSIATRQETAPPVSPPPVVASQQVVAPPKQEPSPASAAAPTAAEVAPAVEGFARAIESRDIGTVRRNYPGLTSDQLRAFEQFFSGSRSINATFRITSVEGSGASAVARVEGVYAFVTGEGMSERRPASFALVLRPEGKAWHITSMR